MKNRLIAHLKKKTQKHHTDDSTAPWSCSAQFPACYMPAKSHLPAGWVFAQKKHGAVIVCLEKLQKDVETLGLLDSSR